MSTLPQPTSDKNITYHDDGGYYYMTVEDGKPVICCVAPEYHIEILEPGSVYKFTHVKRDHTKEVKDNNNYNRLLKDDQN